MSRDLTAAMVAALSADTLRLGYFFEFVMDSATIRLSSTRRDISWNGYTWQGNGWFHGEESLEEDIDADPGTMTIKLTGIPALLLSSLLSDTSSDNSGKIYLVCFDAAGAVVADPYPMFTGLLDDIEISEGAERSDIRVSFVNRLTLLEKTSGFRFTAAAQRSRYGDDAGFDYVASLADWDGRWGANQKKPKKKERDKNKNKKDPNPNKRRKRGI